MEERRRSARAGSADARRNARRILAQLGGARIAIAVLLLIVALMIAASSTRLPLLRNAESALYDARASFFAPSTDTDRRIAMVVYTADTNRAAGQISPVDRTVLAKALAQIDALGAKAIGIDILFDSPQDDDPLLKATLRSMKTPVFLAFADTRTNPDAITYEQEQDLRSYIADVASPRVKAASILLETDGDGVERRWPPQYPSLPPILAVAMSNAAGEHDGRFSRFSGPVRFRLPASTDRPVFDKFPIDLLADPETAPLVAESIKDRYILVGGDFADFDQFDTPFTQFGNPITGERQMIGVEVHASMLAQLLDHALPASIPRWAQWLAALLVIIAGAGTALLSGRGEVIGLAVLAQFAAFLALPFLAESLGYDTLGLPSMGWIVGWILAYTAIAGALRVIGAKEREFAQGALGRYLPRSIATEILRNPDRLQLHGEKRELFCVFSDLEGFTKLTHAMPPESTAHLLNDYLDRLSAIVLEHGGTLDKFVGDAVVAFWGAPIAYPDDGERAVRAARAMHEAGEVFRRDHAEGFPPIGKTRVGVHFGEAVVGNFGGEKRIQYTALGDAMNTAARLEAANKALGTAVLVSREAAERSGLDWFRAMGTVTLRGRSTPVDVFDVVFDQADTERGVVNALVEAHEKGDSTAVERLTVQLTAHGKDTAVGNLIDRLRATRKGESYVLG